MLRRYYAQVLIWSKHHRADKFLAVLALLESFIIPLPPDVLLISMSLARPKKAIFYAFITTLFSVFGGIIGYKLGYYLWPVVQGFFLQHIFSPEFYEKIRTLYEENLFWSIFIAGYTPIPYKLFTLTAGIFRVNFQTFVLASILGRGLRYFLIGTIIYHKGSRARKWIRLNLNKILMGSSATFILLFILYKILF